MVSDITLLLGGMIVCSIRFSKACKESSRLPITSSHKGKNGSKLGNRILFSLPDENLGHYVIQVCFCLLVLTLAL